MRRNYLRRAIGVAICLGPVGLFALSIFNAHDLSPARRLPAASLIGLALILGALNIWLSFVRPRLYMRCHETMDGYRFVSGVPLVGTVLSFAGGLVGFGAIGLALAGILSLALDAGGLPWFLATTWREGSFWDER